MDFENFLIGRIYKQILLTPFEKKADLVRLKKLFDSFGSIDLNIKAIKFIKAWSLMDPGLVDTLIECDYDFNEMSNRKLKRSFILNEKLKRISDPNYLKSSLTKSKIKNMAKILIKSLTNCIDTNHYYKILSDLVTQSGLYGLHSMQHLFQAWLYVNNLKHPAKNFVHMYETGGRAFRRLEFELGEINIETINRKLKNYHNKNYKKYLNQNISLLETKLPLDVGDYIMKYYCTEIDYPQLSYYMHMILSNN